jgi:hypothetical protein
VTNSSVHAILGELHKLLGTYKTSDFLEASKYAGTSRHMRVALRFLAREAEPGARYTTGQKTRSGNSSGGVIIDERSQFLNLLRRSPFFDSTRSILEYASSIGFRLAASPKESRQRLASRLATLVEKLPEAKRREVIGDLLKERGNQTQGWIEVIKER